MKDFAFLFDLDGVIVDSMPVHTRAWSAYLQQLGLPATDAAIESRMHGKRNDDIVADFIGRGLDAAAVFEHGAAKERLFRQLMKTRLKERLVRGIEEFLARFEGIPMAVASNAEPANIDFVLDGAGLRSRFRVIVDGQQVDRPKPFPDVYLRAAALLDVSPGNCIVFEDSPAGVAAGRAAGMRVVGVQTHSANLPDVDFSIHDFEDRNLEAWLRDAAFRPMPFSFPIPPQN
ncbi:MAG TPA: HAD family phosphatase [Bryobacteraceae bacterium]